MAEQQELVEYGRPIKFDKNFRGPLWRSRNCTDVPCLVIFFFFLGGWGFIAQYALKNGDLNKLMVPTDSSNQKCGIDSSVLDRKYLFFFDLEKCIDPFVPLTGCATTQVCVQSCPTRNFFWDTMKNTESFATLKSLLICQNEVDKLALNNKNDIQLAIDENRCASWYMKSAPFLNRCMWEFSAQVCEIIPKAVLARIRPTTPPQASNAAKKLTPEEDLVQCRTRSQLGESVIKEKMMHTDTRVAKFVGNLLAHFYNGIQNPQQLGEEIVEDIFNSWQVVFVAVVCTLIASLFFIALMRWLAGPIVWFSILGVLAGLAVGIYYTIMEYYFWRNNPTVPNHGVNVQAVVKTYLQQAETWLYLSIVLGVSLLIILLVVIVLRSRISVAIAIVKEGSKAVSCIISTVFFPILSWVLYIVVIIFTIIIGLYLGSMGDPLFRMVRRLDPNMSKEQCICTGAAANYSIGERCEPLTFQQNCVKYGTRSPCTEMGCSFSKIDNPPIVDSFIVYNVFGFFWVTCFISAFSEMVLAATFATWYWTFKKGDVPYFTLTRAFRQTVFYHLGTLAFGSLILAICRFIRLVLEYIDAKLKKFDNSVTRAILCCMRCFFWLLENFLRFLNRNAYIMCAIHGKSFCSSATDAFNLIMRNCLRVVIIDNVTDFLFFMSKLLLTASAGVATYFFFTRNPSVVMLHHTAVPTALVVIASFLITSVFFGVYSMAVDTLFLCFLEDSERNDGSLEKPYYMSKNLMRILGKRNERPRRNR